ncbi:hypothetical protein [Salmonirosea aquatica]|uniref:Uncharacterized protein n=1 Tax=Salmonirosea aquatica TaxID=2654236 RepID=A0A7C9BK11_9BACT|nr:hypothetical protein [Cytophagaceae bacterium SJW1-29]
MNLEQRVINKIFKSYIGSSIEYHAGGYFVRKKAAYLIFESNNTVYYLEKEEGLHPNDNRYDKLAENLRDAKLFEFFSVNSHILSFSNSEVKALILPSIFIENLDHQSLTELLIDWGNNNTQIYHYVYG